MKKVVRMNSPYILELQQTIDRAVKEIDRLKKENQELKEEDGRLRRRIMDLMTE